MADSAKILWDEKEVANRLGVAESTVRNWRAQGRGPQSIKLPTGAVRYRPEDVVRWVDSGYRRAG
ncbi:helix-turn-helix domain-containing protein [Paracoccus sp. MBLB3053]|uniref:Helix-turn-helix domain-containing protein n=1 Tax=Paracoccus aurantius TaxID=3073814 RepID=A0ABU2HZ19_9RHOB|nr:helix-turn-helix domain-containing protein [Paracoccus sp. MBLB3053]MDS9470291.1 helix-turn-helix domain-containing protein [Paracoccus sp. MBLB3053]